MPREGSNSRASGKAGASGSGQSSRSSSSSSRGLNASVGQLHIGEAASQTNRRSDGLRQLWIDDGILMSAHEVAVAMITTFKKYIHPEGIAWKHVPAETRAQYFEEFNKLFTWEPHLEEIMLRKWTGKASERYKDMIYKIKRDRNQGRPPYISETVWPVCLTMWDTDASKEKSRKAQKNRLTEPDGLGTGIVKHKGRSRCAQQHATPLAKEKKVLVDQIGWEVFLRLHCSDGVFSNPKSARTASEVRARTEELSQSLPGTIEPREVNMTAMYLDVVGGF